MVRVDRDRSRPLEAMGTWIGVTDGGKLLGGVAFGVDIAGGATEDEEELELVLAVLVVLRIFAEWPGNNKHTLKHQK